MLSMSEYFIQERGLHSKRSVFSTSSRVMMAMCFFSVASVAVKSSGSLFGRSSKP